MNVRHPLSHSHPYDGTSNYDHHLGIWICRQMFRERRLSATGETAREAQWKMAAIIRDLLKKGTE